MGIRSSLHEDFVRVKTLMGLEPFEVRFFVGQKFTKFNLALKLLIRNFLKLVHSLLMMFLTIWLVRAVAAAVQKSCFHLAENLKTSSL